MSITRARDDRGHYLPTGEIPYSLEPEAWDDTCRHKPKPAELKPCAETFGHEPVSNDVDYWGETTDDPPVCARCTRHVREWSSYTVGYDERAGVQWENGWIHYWVRVPWPCTSAIVLGLTALPTT